MRSKNFLLVFILFCVVVAWQCSTDKNRFINRSYHNTTAHYNGYFNAREAIKESLKNFRSSYRDNYEDILPVTIYPNEEESKGFFSVMDTSIKKCATVIKRHAMPEKKTGSKEGEEWGKWMDNNWFIIGVAHFHKKEFERAEEIFKYVSNTYPEDENYNWSRLWMAKNHIEAKNFNAGNRILLELQGEIDAQTESKEKNKEGGKGGNKSGYSISKSKSKKKNTSWSANSKEEVKHPELTKKFILDKKLAECHLYVKTKQYKKAITAIEETLDIVKNRKTKARLYFILAQLQQENGQLAASGESYQKVLKYNPPYEMAFYAQINQVFVSTGNNTNSLRNKLIRLSKDDKNIEYLDVIYFALAELEFKEKNEPKGIEYLKKSVAYSKNIEKKAKSYLRLADLYYAKKSYVPSQSYYDSTLLVINDAHKRHREVSEKNKSLKELVAHLNTIHFQDSVRDLANNYSEKEIVKKIEKIIAQKKREDEELNRQNNSPAFLANTPQQLPSFGGVTTFWAYDQNLRAQGFNDFKQTWGSRKNEDNWRRADKTAAFVNLNTNESEVDSSGQKLEYSIEYYLKDIPFTEEQKLRSDSLLVLAYFGSGTIYKQYLRDYPEAINSFNKLPQLFPENELTAGAHFNLYLIYNEQNKTDLAEKHKKAILNFFPETEYAKILSDPDYFNNKSKALLVQKAEYEQLLDLFNQQNYIRVVGNTDKFISAPDTSNQFYCRSIYLRATSVGYMSKKDSVSDYEKALALVTKNCPEDAVAELAQNTLDIIRKTNTENKTQISGVSYKYDATAQHYFVYIHDSQSGGANPVKIAFSDFTRTSFSTLNLNTSSAIYSNSSQLIVVKPFNNKKDAENFLSAVRANKQQLGAYNTDPSKYFIISQANYLLLYKEKDMDGYMVFYRKNYKK